MFFLIEKNILVNTSWRIVDRFEEEEDSAKLAAELKYARY